MTPPVRPVTLSAPKGPIPARIRRLPSCFCGFCGAPVSGGLHTDSLRRDCRWSGRWFL